MISEIPKRNLSKTRKSLSNKKTKKYLEKEKEFTEKLNIAKTALETLRKSMNTTQNNPQGANILQFRKDMAILRSFDEPSIQLNSLSTQINFIILGIIITVLYPIFNMMYINDSLFVTYIVSLGVILVLAICCIIGFISKILP